MPRTAPASREKKRMTPEMLTSRDQKKLRQSILRAVEREEQRRVIRANPGRTA